MSSKSFIVITILLSFLCSAYSSQISVETLMSYNKWRASNKRNYLNDDEQIFRQTVFFENLKKIKAHNSNPKNTYTIGTNQFSDMTEEEFTSMVLNSRMSDHTVKTQDQPVLKAASAVTAAASIDWRTKGAVSKIKNQGNCGSCWTFSTSALMESVNFLKTGNLLDFAEQQLLDCVIQANGYYSFGCSGGVPYYALTYSMKYGIVEETAYPYVAAQKSCNITSITTGFKPKSVSKIPATVNDLQNALNASPVTVAVDASKWSSYKSGVFTGCSSTVSLNHAVLAIGYDASGNWIIKNSWGTYWGESGFIRLAAGNSCGILNDTYMITA